MSQLSEHVAIYKSLGHDGFIREHPHPMLLHIRQTFTDNQNIVGTVNFPAMLARTAPNEVEVSPVIKRSKGSETEGISVGRAPECDIPLDYQDISKRHAIFQRTGPHAFTVQDLGSRNGTSINGKLLTANTPGTVEDGTDVAFARIHTCFMLPEGFAMLVKWAKLPG